MPASRKRKRCSGRCTAWGLAVHKTTTKLADGMSWPRNRRRIAEFGLGDMYFQGLRVGIDEQAAAEWYQRAADTGDARAQVALGFQYRTGKGKPRDVVQAGQFFTKAAAQETRADFMKPR